MNYKTGQRSDVDSVRCPVQVIGSIGSSKKSDSGKDELLVKASFFIAPLLQAERSEAKQSFLLQRIKRLLR